MDAAISALSLPPEDLQAQLAGVLPPLVIDVRRTPAFLSSTQVIVGALRRDPTTVAEWSHA